MTTRWSAPRLYVEMEGDTERSVTWLELFYDLIFVAALVQLGEGLADDLTGLGVGRFAAGFLLLWWSWTGTTFYMNRFVVDDLPHRLLVLGQMFAIGLLAVGVEDAFGERSAYFALSYAAVRVLLIVMYWRADRSMKGHPLSRRFVVYFSVAVVLWIGSVLVPVPYRFLIWLVAFAVELAGPFGAPGKASVRGSPPDLAHMRERYALFTIIVLGESLIKLIGALASEDLLSSAPVLGALGFVIAAGLWWTYFDDVAGARLHSTRNAAYVWVYSHLPLAAGLTALGVGVKKLAKAAPAEALSTSARWLLLGSLALALLSIAAIDHVTESRFYGVRSRDRTQPRIAAAAAVVLIGVFGTNLTATVVAILTSAVVVGQMAIEVLVAVREDRRLRVDVASAMRDAVDEACEHLVVLEGPPVQASGCQGCMEIGHDDWVHLRACIVCGWVGCCDDSPGRHATAHFAESGHPIMRSIEPGESWAWCFLHEMSVVNR